MIDPAYIDKLTSRLAVLEAELADPATVANQARYRTLLAEHQNLQRVRETADTYFRLLRERDEAVALSNSDEPELRDMARSEVVRIESELPAAEHALKLALLPPDPDDSRNTIMEIRAGTGGEEAALFAADLFRMYSKFAASRGWRVAVIDASPSDLGGFKEIIFSVEGENVYRLLRYESGCHRVQRVPETEAQGRIHTSAATVAVLPEAQETDEVVIRPEDIRIDLFRASGAGGQKVNKTESAVRITHLPTGLVVQCQDERSQHKNRERALKVLAARLLDRIRSEEQARLAGERRAQVGSGDRSERIRTYNFPQNRVTDHRINLTLYSLDRVMEGELDPLVQALYERDLELKLQQHLGHAAVR
ncbi:MAG: peptide chain release factor 1 [Kiritimatiellae bacterium]|nr:peptide chain release factor 1 [Kiritimatiellia bacterium]MDW8458178.1 peptide chain release factor 1 [Verrucomicrobiota bacterium]